MTWTREDLENLENAIKECVLIVKYSDKEVRYQSLDDMLKLRRIMKKSLGLAPKGYRVVSRFSKGL